MYFPKGKASLLGGLVNS